MASTCSAPWFITASTAYSWPSINPSTRIISCSRRARRGYREPERANEADRTRRRALLVVHTHDAAASGKGQRLQHGGKRNDLGERVHIGVHGHRMEERHSHARRPQPGPTEQLVTSRPRGFGGMAGKTQAFAARGRQSPSDDRRRPAHHRSASSSRTRARCRSTTSSSAKRIGRARSLHGSSRTWQRSVAKTKSTPRRSAASPKSGSGNQWWSLAAELAACRRLWALGFRLQALSGL